MGRGGEREMYGDAWWPCYAECDERTISVALVMHETLSVRNERVAAAPDKNAVDAVGCGASVSKYL